MIKCPVVTPDFAEWIDKKGLDFTLETYIGNGFKLPSYNSFEAVNQALIAKADLSKEIDKFLPSGEFKIDGLSKIIQRLPIEAKAAFFNKVLYFTENPMAAHVGEEVFHAIFQTMLSPAQKQVYLKAGQQLFAQSGQTLEQLQEKYPQAYQGLSKQEALAIAHEEAIAAEFVKYYLDNRYRTFESEDTTDLQTKLSAFGKFAQSIAKALQDLFRYLTRLFKATDVHKDNLNLFFQQIMKGGFKNSPIVSAGNTRVAVTSLITYKGKDADGDAFESTMSDQESNQFVLTLAQAVLEIRQVYKDNGELIGINELLDLTLDSVRNFYKKSTLPDKDKYVSALHPDSEYSDTESIKKDILTYINQLADLKGNQKLDYEEISQGTEDIDLQGSDTIAANEKGFDAMSAYLKAFISTVGIEVPGSSLNTGLTDENGQPITIPLKQMADPNVVYYALARSMADTAHEMTRLKKLKDFAHLKNNQFTKALWDKMVFQVTGQTDTVAFNHSVDNLYTEFLKSGDIGLINNLTGLKNDKKFLLQTILKGFDLWKRDNWYVKIDPETANLLQAGNANGNLASDFLMNVWKDHLIGKEDITLPKLTALLKDFDPTTVRTLKDVPSIAFDLQETFKKVFGNFPLEIATGLVHTAYGYPLPSYLDAYQNLMNFSSITKNDIFRILEGFKKLNNIYDTEKGIASKLSKLAELVAQVDENAVESTYKNAENKSIYSYQQKTFQLMMFNEFFSDKKRMGDLLDSIKEGKVLEYQPNKFLKQASDYLTNHYFAVQAEKDPEYLAKVTAGKFFSIDGITNSDTEESTTFSGISTHDFDLYQLFLRMKESPSVINGVTYRPILINIMEAKRTASLVELPEITGLVEKGLLTEKAKEILVNEIKREYDRIRRVTSEIQNLVDFIAENAPELIKVNQENITTIKINPSVIYSLRKLGLTMDYIEDFYPKTITLGEGNRVTKLDGRGSKFTDYLKGLMPPSSFAFLEKNAMDITQPEIDFTKGTEITTIKQRLQSNFNNYVKETLAHFKTNKYDSLVPKIISTDNDVLRNMLLSDYMNTLFINQLMQSDPALLFKTNGVDFFKRAGGQNAALMSLKTGFTRPDLGINVPTTHLNLIVGTDATGFVGFEAPETKVREDAEGNMIEEVTSRASVDQADAQSYMTVQGYRKYLHGVGKLTGDIAAILDKIQTGFPLSAKEIAIIRDDNYLNVLKPVGFDGFRYIKTGTVMLTKDITSILKPEIVQPYLESGQSYQDALRANAGMETNWMAKPGSEFLHDMRLLLESKSIDLFMPKTASKLLNVNVFDTKNFSTTDFDYVDYSVMQIDADYIGSQMENPAGKEKIIDPSQMLEIITNELGQVQIYWKGTETDVIVMQQEFQKLLSARDEVNFNIAVNEMFDEQFIIKWKPFLQKARETIVSSGGDIQTIEFYTLDDNGNKVYNPNMSISKDKFVNLIFSHFTSGVIQHKIPGDALALVSSKGIKKLKKIVRYQTKSGRFVYSWETIKDGTAEYFNELYKAQNYHFVEDEKSLDVIYDESDTLSQLTSDKSDQLIAQLKTWYESGVTHFFDELRHLKPKWETVDGIIQNENPVYFTEAVLPSWKKGIEITAQTRYMFGVRIPSQDKHSAINIEWIDTIPEYYGNTIITAKEIIYLSGSDFDIDKLYLYKSDVYEDDNGEYTQYDTDNFEQFLSYQIKNNKGLISYLSSALSEDEEFAQLKRKLKTVKKDNKQLWQEIKEETEVEEEQIKRLKEIRKTHESQRNELYKLEDNLDQKRKEYIKEEKEKKFETATKAVKSLNIEIKKLTGQLEKLEVRLAQEDPATATYQSIANSVMEMKEKLQSTKTLRNLTFAEALRVDTTNIVSELEEVREKISKKASYLKGLWTKTDNVIAKVRGRFAEAKQLKEEVTELQEQMEAVQLKYILNYLKDTKLPSTEQEYKENPVPVVGRINNELLRMRNSFLTNKATLQSKLANKAEIDSLVETRDAFFNYIGELTEKDGTILKGKEEEHAHAMIELDIALDMIKSYKPHYIKAPYKTPATQELLQFEVEKSYYTNSNGEKVYMFTTDGKYPNGSNMFFSTSSKWSVHSFLGHSNAHKNVQTGKKNIGVDVNYNLMAIVLNKLKVSLTKDIEINGVAYRDFTSISQDMERVFDTISTFVSAATDEAKDQQNAKYRLNIAAINIAMPMIMLGVPTATVIAIIQQPIIQEFLSKLSVKDYIIQTYEQAKAKYDSDVNILRSLLAVPVVNTNEYVDTNEDDEVQKITLEKLRNGYINKENPASYFQKEVGSLAFKILQTGLELSPLMEFVKLKKGFGKDLDSFDKLSEAVQKMFPQPPKDPYTNLIDRFEYNAAKEDSLIQQFNGYAPIVNKLEKILNQNVFDKSSVVKRFKQAFSFQLKNTMGKEAKQKLNESVMSFLYSQIYNRYSNSPHRDLLTRPLSETIDTWESFLKERGSNPAIEELFKGNSFITKLQVKTDKYKTKSLQLPTFTKMSPASQMSLIDGFSDLFYKTLNDPLMEKYKLLPHQLFHYFVGRDGWLFKGGSLSKGIPAFFFKHHSDSIDRFLSDETVKEHYRDNLESYNFFIAEALATDLKNKDMLYDLSPTNDGIVNTVKGEVRSETGDYNNIKIDITNYNTYELSDAKKAILENSLVSNKVFKMLQLSNVKQLPPYSLELPYFLNRKDSYQTEQGSFKTSKVLYALSKVSIEDVHGYKETIPVTDYIMRKNNQEEFVVNGGVYVNYTITNQDEKGRKAKFSDKNLLTEPVNLDRFDKIERTERKEPVVIADTVQSVVTEIQPDSEISEQLQVEIPVIKTPLQKYELFPNTFANVQQTDALDKMHVFLQSKAKDDNVFVLVGRGGTGKTTIIKKLLQDAKNKDNYAGAAISHQAKKILARSIGSEKTMTVARLLAIKLNEETGTFEPDLFKRQKGQVPISKLDLIIIDETSMISQEIMNEILSLKKPSAKVIFMGDNAQLPPIGQEEGDSPTFKIYKGEKNFAKLTERMRQGETSPIVPITDIVAANVESENPKLKAISKEQRISKLVNGNGVIFDPSEKSAIEHFVKDFREAPEDVYHVKMVTFNNQNNDAGQSVKNLNNKARQLIYGEQAQNQFNVGELVTAYGAFGADENEEPLVQNSESYIVRAVELFPQYTQLATAFSKAKGQREFLATYDIIILDLINEDMNIVQVPVIAQSSKAKYKQDLDKLWKTDTQLAYALTNLFADIQYGYAVTTHKAQGSTYKNVYVFEDNILGNSNLSSIEAKNKSLYTAITRPSDKLVIVSTTNNPLDSQGSEDVTCAIS